MRREEHSGCVRIRGSTVNDALLPFILSRHQDRVICGVEFGLADHLVDLLLRKQEDDDTNVVVLRGSEERPKEVDDGLGLADPRV